jgi:phenylpropionate dioxygenase-like ring-hydroxylating dioxygenase large terminal subunit
MFPKNCWYVAASSREIVRSLSKRTIAGEQIIMYRTEAGAPVAMLDMCPHRLAPLSLGQLVGDAVECGYHGVTFDCTGKCIRVPGEHKVLERFAATTFPAIERWGFVWVWLGEREKADEALLPQAFHWLTEPGWCPLEDYVHVKAHYQLLIDNLLDLSHEAFAHKNTIGNAAVAETPATTTVNKDTIEVQRFMPDCAPPKLFVRAAGFDSNIDRFQKITFLPPCFVVIEVWAVKAGTNDKANGLVWWVLNALTPETEKSTHYFWGLPRQFKQDDQELTEMLRAGITRTFEEDKAILEQQQLVIERVPLEKRSIFTRADQAPTRARQMVTAMLDEEPAVA